MRKLFAVLCLLGALYFLLPLSFGVCHIGMLYPAAALLYAALRLWPLRLSGRLPRKLRAAADAFAVVVAAVSLLVSCMMYTALRREPPETVFGSAVVVVPGCQTIGARPSVMLQKRIDTAYGCLAVHADTPCIASGGIGDEETVSEADVIADVLIAKGIAAERIYREIHSRSTQENMRLTAQIIRTCALPDTVLIASDGFHQYRCAYMARREGLTPYALPCASPWYMAGGYWCREIVAILSLLLP